MHKSKEFASNLSSSIKLSPLMISMLSSWPILLCASSQNSSDKSMPVAGLPRLYEATSVEPVPLKGSIILPPLFEKVLMSFSHKETG